MRFGCSTPPTFSMTRPFEMLWGEAASRRPRPGSGCLAGQERFEPPTRGFGDRCSSRSSYWPIPPTPALLGLLVLHVLAAARAVLGERELVLRLLLVLRGRVVPLLAGLALERHDAAIAGHGLPSSLDDVGHDTGADRSPALADREAKRLSHRDGRDERHRHRD